MATEAAARAERFRRTKRIEVPGIDQFGRSSIGAWRAALDLRDGRE